MDIRESIYNDPEEAMRALIDGVRTGIWTAMPVIVQKDSDGHTVDLKIVTKARIKDHEGKTTHVDYPLIKDALVHFAGAGDGEDSGKENPGVVFTHPVRKGDEGTVVFMSRPMEDCAEKGGIQEGVDLRTHSLSDAIFYPGARSKPRRLKNLSTTTAQMRSVDGKHFSEIDAKNGRFTTSVDGGKHVTTIDKTAGISLKSSVALNIEAPKGTFKMDLKVDGKLKATKAISSDVGVKAPLFDGAPGTVDDTTPVS